MVYTSVEVVHLRCVQCMICQSYLSKVVFKFIKIFNSRSFSSFPPLFGYSAHILSFLYFFKHTKHSYFIFCN